ncbi:phage tail tape measure protein [Bacillus sp. ISL-46]|uniref:phage tail tape measure protein n=1 Tax=Bacillus sp. ISL-46 TaxID=2819129 RepID=UPI001BEB06E2|nr:phage tail tape measure protein [Bacillus sp. ISL-46]MBT2722318.1 phage tail tape measure protein [Bacillus sp. ISL-46]
MEIFKLFGSIFIDNDKADKAIDDTEKKGQGLSKVFGTLGGAAATAGKLIGGALLAGTGLAGVGIGAMVLAGDDLQKALNGLQASTGSTTDEMKDMGDSVKEIYGNNFGESFEQIGEVMANAKKITGEWGEDLKYLTQDALMFSDTFGYDTNESIRSADKLMKQFGLAGSDAMALIAEGSQKGLNYADDLLPTIDEYSVYFKQAGFSASEMFGLFQNAKSAGIFNLDYAGDAIKEFGIIMTEQGGSAAETLDNMGLNGAALQKQFAKGGDGAKKALAEISQALAKEKNPQKQYSDGVALFGTKFEDVGAKGILAMTKTNDSIKGSIDVLNEINEIKYDSFGEALTGIGRQITTGIILPLSEKVMPKLNEFAQWISGHLPQIKSGIETAIGGATEVFNKLKTAIKFVIDNFNIIGPIIAGVTATLTAQLIINTLVGLYGKWKAATQAQTTMQWLLNAAMNANPIGLVALAIGALIAVGLLLWKNWDSVSKWLTKSWQWIKNVAVSVFDWLVGFFKKWGLTILAVITGPIGILALLIFKNWDKIKSKSIEIWSAIKTKAAEIWGNLKSAIVGKASEIWNSVKSKFESLKNSISEKMNAAKSKAVGIFGEIKSAITGKAGEIWSNIKTKFENIKSAITKPINAARDAVSTALGKIKSLFSGLGLKLPDIKTPHFKLKNWSKNPLDWVKNMPSLGIEWYAKGTNYADGGLSVVGEHGPEILNIPRGSQVKNASETRGLLDKRGGDINVQIDAKSVDLDEYQLLRVFQRLEVLHG